MTFLAPVLPVLAGAAMLGGTGLSMFSSIKEGNEKAEAYKAQGEAARYNQRVAQQGADASEANARGTETARDVWEEQQLSKQLRLRGSQAAGYGAAGVMMEGTPLDMLVFTAGEHAKEILAGRYNFNVEAANYRNQASRSRSKADFYGWEAERQDSLAGPARTAGWLKAGTQLLTLGGSLAGGTTGVPSFMKSY